MDWDGDEGMDTGTAAEHWADWYVTYSATQAPDF